PPAAAGDARPTIAAPRPHGPSASTAGWPSATASSTSCGHGGRPRKHGLTRPNAPRPPCGPAAGNCPCYPRTAATPTAPTLAVWTAAPTTAAPTGNSPRTAAARPRDVPTRRPGPGPDTRSCPVPGWPSAPPDGAGDSP